MRFAELDPGCEFRFHPGYIVYRKLDSKRYETARTIPSAHRIWDIVNPDKIVILVQSSSRVEMPADAVATVKS